MGPLRVTNPNSGNIRVGPGVQQPSGGLSVSGPRYQAPQQSGINWGMLSMLRSPAALLPYVASRMAPFIGQQLTNSGNNLSQENHNWATRNIAAPLLTGYGKTIDHSGQLLRVQNPYHGTMPQVIGQVGEDALNVASLMPVAGTARLGLTAGKLGLKGLGVKVAQQGAINGGFGLGYGVAGGMQDPNATLGSVAQSGAIGAGIGAGIGALTPVAGAAIGKGLRVGNKAIHATNDAFNAQLDKIAAEGARQDAPWKFPSEQPVQSPAVHSIEPNYNAFDRSGRPDPMMPTHMPLREEGFIRTPTGYQKGIEDTLYHYTDPDAAISILKQGKLRPFNFQGSKVLSLSRNGSTQIPQNPTANKGLRFVLDTSKVGPTEPHAYAGKRAAWNEAEERTNKAVGADAIKRIEINVDELPRDMLDGKPYARTAGQLQEIRAWAKKHGVPVVEVNSVKSPLNDLQYRNLNPVNPGRGVKLQPAAHEAGFIAFHGTNKDNINSILDNGFDVNAAPPANDNKFVRGYKGVNVNGNGVYVYRPNPHLNSAEVVSQYGTPLKVKVPDTLKLYDLEKGHLTGANKGLPNSIKLGDHGKALTKALQKQGYDGTKSGSTVVVFDPKNVKVVGVGGYHDPLKTNMQFKTPNEHRNLLNSESGAVGLNEPLNGGEKPPRGTVRVAGGQSDPNGVPRGLATSVQEAPNLSVKVKTKVNGTYTPKPNTQLMGEAKALLSDGASLDFKNVKNIDQKVAATMQHALNLDSAGKHNEAAALFNNLAEHGTELGRGVQAFAMLKKMSPQSIALSAAGRIKKYNLTATKKIPELTGAQQKEISEAADKIAKMAKGAKKNEAINELNIKIGELIPSSFTDKAIAVWKAGLLTSFRTHERNLLGNSIMQGAEVVKDLPATMADKLMSTKTGTRTLTSTIQGLREAGTKATRQEIKDLVTKGYDPHGEVSKYDVNRITWDKTPVQQALKTYTDAVFRTLGAEDRAFHNAAFARSMYDQAQAAAINAGKKGDKAFASGLVKKPSEDMLKNAAADAAYATFKDRNVLTSTAGQIKRTLAEKGGSAGKAIGEVVMPFTGVPSSIAEKTIAYSPIGLIKGATKVGKVMSGQVPELQRKAAQEVGRGVVGSGLMGLGALLMQQGLMTGQPKDKAESEQWALEGKQANSVLIGGKWRSINSIGPQNLIMLAGAKTNEAMKDPEGSIAKYGMGLLRDQMSQTFLAGIMGPMQAITDNERYGQSYANSLASSVVPNIVKDTSKAFDKTQREVNNVGEAIKGSLPGFRNNLLPKRDVMGNEMKQEPSGIAAYFDLFNSKTPISTPVVDELTRLYSVDQSAIPSKLKAGQTVLPGEKVTLTPTELDQLEQDTGQPIRQQFEALMSTPEYQAASDDIKKKTLDGIVTQVRAQARLGLADNATGENGLVDLNQIGGKAKMTLAKDAFDKSGKNYQVVGDTVLRRGLDGNITATPKIKYDYQVGSAMLTQQRNSGDVNGWLDTAQKQLANIEQQLKDPSIDPLEAMTLQNAAAAISKSMNKYKGQGGFTKGKKLKVSAIKPFKISKTPNVNIGKLNTKGITVKKFTQPKLGNLKIK